MTKYTGYGNAAGLFANRGLLGGHGGPSADYSSDSEDSDTDEYKEIQHAINPVLGCYEPPRPDPFAGMSDEQKEYEAMVSGGWYNYFILNFNKTVFFSETCKFDGQIESARCCSTLQNWIGWSTRSS